MGRGLWGLTQATLLGLALLMVGCGGGVVSPPAMPTAVPPTATSPAAPSGTGDVIIGLATVESVDVLIAESYPVQVRAVVRGNLPDGCTKISHSTQSVESDLIRITLYTRRSADLMCTQALVPFEHSIPVDISGLADGRYTVEVNGVRVPLDLQGSGN